MTRQNSKDTKLRAHTEHAFAQINEVIPAIGYVPPSKRANKKHVIIVTELAPTKTDINLGRIAFADPIGFLAALMQGQPVATHKVNKDGSVTTEWVNATVEHRAIIARYFSDKLVPYMTRLRATDTERPAKGDDADQLFNNAAGRDGET